MLSYHERYSTPEAIAEDARRVQAALAYWAMRAERRAAVRRQVEAWRVARRGRGEAA